MLTIMCGLPGSGKSVHLSNNFSELDPGEVILCPDDFRLALTGQRYYGPAEDSVWSHVKITARVLLGNEYPVTIDATHLTIQSRRSWIRLARELDIPIDCLWQNVSTAIAMERNHNRSADQIVPQKVMEQMVSQFILPNPDEGFREVIRIAE